MRPLKNHETDRSRKALLPGPYAKTAGIDDPDFTDERYNPSIEGRPWNPSAPGEELSDYTRLQGFPGCSVEKTDEILARLGLSRSEVLISARGRYYWVGPQDKAGRPVGAPDSLLIGANNEILAPEENHA